MTEPIKTIEGTHDGKPAVLRIFTDDSPESPREWDNLGTLKTWHRSYDFSDDDAPNIDSDDFEEWAKENDVALYLPVYMLDHSGVRLSTRDFCDRWDSGQVGYIWVTRDKLRQEYGQARITKALLKKAQAVLQGEIETLDQYASGDVYGFVIERPCKCGSCGDTHAEHIDSCFGFYGQEAVEDGAKEAGFKAA